MVPVFARSVSVVGEPGEYKVTASQLEFFATDGDSEAILFTVFVTLLPCNEEHYEIVRDPYYRCQFGEYHH